MAGGGREPDRVPGGRACPSLARADGGSALREDRQGRTRAGSLFGNDGPPVRPEGEERLKRCGGQGPGPRASAALGRFRPERAETFRARGRFCRAGVGLALPVGVHDAVEAGMLHRRRPSSSPAVAARPVRGGPRRAPERRVPSERTPRRAAPAWSAIVPTCPACRPVERDARAFHKTTQPRVERASTPYGASARTRSAQAGTVRRPGIAPSQTI